MAACLADSTRGPAARTSLIIAEFADDMEAIEHVQGLPGALGGEPLEEALEGLDLALLADPQPSGGSAAGSAAPGGLLGAATGGASRRGPVPVVCTVSVPAGASSVGLGEGGGGAHDRSSGSIMEPKRLNVANCITKTIPSTQVIILNFNSTALNLASNFALRALSLTLISRCRVPKLRRTVSWSSTRRPSRA